jgi:hypothetical protein
VRTLVVFLIFLPGVCDLFAQEQESKLVNRLLKPNTSLKNSAEGKQFVATGTVSFDKNVSTPSFSSREKPAARTFPVKRDLTPVEFATKPSRASNSVADLSTRSRPVGTEAALVIPAGPEVRLAPESAATSPVREYAGNRPFLAQGKSQKALQTKNKPLTIEQVRELLNKSK